MNAAGPPLPPGWEARWDRNQGAYFFIDHTTKKTTWIDPRIAMYQQQQPKQPQQQQYGGQQHGGHHAAAAQLLNQTSVNSPSTREIPLDSLNRVDNRGHTQGKDHTTQFSVKHPPPETTDDHVEETIKELVKSCPGAGQQMVKDVLASCNNDKFKAKIALRAMGYTDSTEGSTSRETTQGKESLTKHTYSTEIARDTTQRDHIPTKHTYTAAPAREERNTSPQRETISEDEKKRIKQRVIGAFPDLEADVIDIALNICKYKEGDCRTLLKGWNEKKKPEMSSRSKTEDSGFSDFSSRPTTSMSTEPVAIDMNAGLPVTLELDPIEKPSPKKGGSPKKKKQTKDRSRTPEHRPSPSRTPEHRPPPSRTPENRPSSSRTRQQPAAKSAKSPQKKKQTPVPVTREQHFARSEYRTTTMGPNPELRHGPDESLLLTERLIAMGPNPELQQGPDESRLGERTVAMGPNPDLVQGPMFQQSPTRLIVSPV